MDKLNISTLSAGVVDVLENRVAERMMSPGCQAMPSIVMLHEGQPFHFAPTRTAL